METTEASRLITGALGFAEFAMLTFGPVDHIGITAPAAMRHDIEQYARDHNSTVRAFDSVIAAKEHGEPITMLMLTGLMFTIEIMLTSQNLTPHVAFAVPTKEELTSQIPAMKDLGYVVPAFMNDAPMENPSEGVTLIYFDTGLIRFEFIHRDR